MTPAYRTVRRSWLNGSAVWWWLERDDGDGFRWVETFHSKEAADRAFIATQIPTKCRDPINNPR